MKVVEGGAGFGKNQQVVLADFEVIANVVGGDCEEQLGEEIFVDVERHDAWLRFEEYHFFVEAGDPDVHGREVAHSEEPHHIAVQDEAGCNCPDHVRCLLQVIDVEHVHSFAVFQHNKQLSLGKRYSRYSVARVARIVLPPEEAEAFRPEVIDIDCMRSLIKDDGYSAFLGLEHLRGHYNPTHGEPGGHNNLAVKMMHVISIKDVDSATHIMGSVDGFGFGGHPLLH